MPTHSKIPDEVLVDQLRHGSGKAFGDLYDRYYLLMLRFSAGLLGDYSAAQDIASDCFLKLWNHRTKLGKGGSVKAFLYSVTKNLTMDYLKTQKRKVNGIIEMLDIPDENEIQAKMVDAETYDSVLKHWDNLPGGEKQVLDLLLEGKSLVEIAHQLGTTKQNISKKKWRGIQRLQDHLGKQLIVPGLSFMKVFIITICRTTPHCDQNKVIKYG